MKYKYKFGWNGYCPLVGLNLWPFNLNINEAGKYFSLLISFEVNVFYMSISWGKR